MRYVVDDYNDEYVPVGGGLDEHCKPEEDGRSWLIDVVATPIGIDLTCPPETRVNWAFGVTNVKEHSLVFRWADDGGVWIDD